MLKIFYTIFSIKYATYFVFYFIVLLNTVAAYLLSKQVVKNSLYAKIFTLFFVFSPLLISKVTTMGTISFILSMAGYNLGLYFYDRYTDDKSTRNLIGIIISSLLMTHPFTFSFYFAIFFLLIFALDKKKSLFFAFSTILINLFWLLPFASSVIYKKGSLFGSYTKDLVFTNYQQLAKYQYSINFLGFFNFNITDISLVAYFLYMLIFILLFSGVIYLLGRKYQTFRDLRLFFLVLVALMIFSIGPKMPLGFIYSYLYNKFSFFVYFRSYHNALIPAFSIFFMIVLKVSNNFKWFKTALTVFSFSFLAIFLLILLPKIPNKTAQFPNEYFEAKKIVDEDQTDGKVLLLPMTEYDYYKWDNTEGTKKSDKYFLENFFAKSGIFFYRPTLDRDVVYNEFLRLYNDNDYDISRLNNFGIKYILIRKDLMDFERYQYLFYNDKIFKNSHFEKLLDTDNIILYKYNDATGSIETQDAEIYKISPVHYKLKLHNVSERNIVLKEQLHPGWKLFISKNEDLTCVKPVEYKDNLKECQTGSYPLSFSDISFLFKKGLSSSKELIFANGWNIKKEDITTTYDASYYKSNEDGTIEMNIDLYFVPQTYYYLGLIVSGLGILTFIVIRKMVKE
jgi:hypothetical protein